MSNISTGKRLRFPLIFPVNTTPCIIWLYGPSTFIVVSDPKYVCFSKCHLTEQNGPLSRQKNFSLLLCWPWKNAIFSWNTSYNKYPLHFNHFAAGWSCWLCQFSFLVMKTACLPSLWDVLSLECCRPTYLSLSKYLGGMKRQYKNRRKCSVLSTVR